METFLYFFELTLLLICVLVAFGFVYFQHWMVKTGLVADKMRRTHFLARILIGVMALVQIYKLYLFFTQQL